MEQEKFDIWMIEYLSDTLKGEERKEFESFIEESPRHQRQFDRLNETWGRLDVISFKEPGEEMDVRFFDMLNRTIDKSKTEKKKTESWMRPLVELLWKPQIAYGILLLTIGLGIGYFLKTIKIDAAIETPVVRNLETETIREQLVLTLLEQSSANKRLQGVSEAAKLNSANKRIIEALFTTLNNDPNTNVRLVAIESLAKYVENPEVRMGLVKSIGLQDSPLVQIALADLMVALEEKASVESMKKLLRKPDIDTTVKKKLEESINHII